MLKNIIQERLENIAFMRRTGMQVMEASRGFGSTLMPLAGNENHVGGMYMGALTTLAEAGAAVSVSTFLDVERKGSAQYIAELPLLDKQNVVVAQARVTVKILSHRRQK